MPLLTHVLTRKLNNKGLAALFVAILHVGARSVGAALRTFVTSESRGRFFFYAALLQVIVRLCSKSKK